MRNKASDAECAEQERHGVLRGASISLQDHQAWFEVVGSFFAFFNSW